MRAAGFDHVLEGRAKLAERERQITAEQIAREKPRAQQVHAAHNICESRSVDIQPRRAS